MKQNVGAIDKSVRIVVGTLVAGAGLYFQNWLGLFGLVLIGTGLFNTCLLYKPFKLSTKKGA